MLTYLIILITQCLILNDNCALSRCDQYKWVHKGTRTVIFEDYAIKKKTASIDVKDKEKATDDNSFKRLEYWGIGSFYLVHYLGDHTVLVPFEHRNSKNNTKPFIRSAPFIKEKVQNIIMCTYIIYLQCNLIQ